MKQAWFENRDWEFVVAMNAGLCENSGALHRATTDGYEDTRQFWSMNYQRETNLAEAVEFCRQCHRMAPFCNFNGNTFVAIIRDCIAHAAGFTGAQAALARSLAGHMVAGTAEPEEILQFNQLLTEMEHGLTSLPNTPSLKTYHLGDQIQTLKGTLRGVITQIHADGTITWKCDQTGSQLTGTAESLKLCPPTEN